MIRKRVGVPLGQGLTGSGAGDCRIAMPVG